MVGLLCQTISSLNPLFISNNILLGGHNVLVLELGLPAFPLLMLLPKAIDEVLLPLHLGPSLFTQLLSVVLVFKVDLNLTLGLFVEVFEAMLATLLKTLTDFA